MSEPYDNRRPDDRNRGSNETIFNFSGPVNIYGLFLQGIAQGDLFGYSAGTPAAAANTTVGNNSNEGVRNRTPPSNTGRRTRNPPTSRSGNPRPTSLINPHDSILPPSIVADNLSFDDVEGTEDSDKTAQSSIRSTSQPEVNYTDESFGRGEGSTTLVDGTPTEDPITVDILPIPQRLDHDKVMPGSDPETQSSNNSSSGKRSRSTVYSECRTCGDCGVCHGAPVADTSTNPTHGAFTGEPTLGELATPPKKSKGFITKIEQFFRALPKRAKRSIGQLRSLSRQNMLGRS